MSALPLPEQPDWTRDALCAQIGGGEWFPEKGGSSSIRAAKKVCAACPVRQQCLDYALENQEQNGIWGGKTPRERRAMGAARRPTDREAERDLTAKKIRALTEQGHNDTETAVLLGISDRTVQRIRKEYGIEAYRPPHSTRRNP